MALAPDKRDDLGLTPKREAFARAYLELGNARKAYESAYNCENMKPATIGSRSSALLREPLVAWFIDQLRAEAAKRNEITVDNLTQMLHEDRKLARDLGMPAAAISAVGSMAKLHGLMVERSKVTVEKTLTGMSEAELDEFIAATNAKLGSKRDD